MGWSIFSSGSELFRDHEDLFTPYPMLYWSSSRLWRLFYPLPHVELVFIQVMKTFLYLTSCCIGLHQSYEDSFAPYLMQKWSSSKLWRPFFSLPHAVLVFIKAMKTLLPLTSCRIGLHPGYEDLFVPYLMPDWSSFKLWRPFYSLPHAVLVFILVMKTFFHITSCRIGLHQSYEDLFTPYPMPNWSSSTSRRPFRPHSPTKKAFIP